MNDQQRQEVLTEFRKVVNMALAELQRWLATDESRQVDWRHEGEEESVGHRSGARIVAILRAKRSDLADDDYEHMRKVIGYVHRHTAQGGPAQGVEHSRWRYSLMNWGHDPLR